MNLSTKALWKYFCRKECPGGSSDLKHIDGQVRCEGGKGGRPINTEMQRMRTTFYERELDRLITDTR